MGADSLASTMLMFIAVMLMTVAVITLLENYISETSGVVSAKQKSMISQLQTDISIIEVNSSGTASKIYVKNIGSNELRTSCINVILEKELLTNSSFQVLDPDTSLAMTTTWSSTKTILINATHSDIGTDTTHEVKVITCNGISDSYIFSIA
jgi:archaellum component FlaG (FlaF/FlaG flagellin family)